MNKIQNILATRPLCAFTFEEAIPKKLRQPVHLLTEQVNCSFEARTHKPYKLMTSALARPLLLPKMSCWGDAQLMSYPLLYEEKSRRHLGGPVPQGWATDSYVCTSSLGPWISYALAHSVCCGISFSFPNFKPQLINSYLCFKCITQCYALRWGPIIAKK